jgi:predicted enzyme related to lactoylglutathione lyase
MINKIASVSIYVEDQQKALRFWTDGVGFEAVRNQPMGPQASWIEVGLAGTQTSLVIFPRQMMPNWNELKPSLVFECEDIRATYEEMSARGIEFVDPPQAMAWGSFAKFRDPDGNEFLLKG